MDLTSPQQSLYLKEGPVVTEAKVLIMTLFAKLGADAQCIPTFVQFLAFGQRGWDHHHLGPMPLPLTLRAL